MYIRPLSEDMVHLPESQEGQGDGSVNRRGPRKERQLDPMVPRQQRTAQVEKHVEKTEIPYLSQSYRVVRKILLPMRMKENSFLCEGASQ